MEKRPLGFLTLSGIIAAALVILIVVGVGLARGGVLFSPGGLNAKTGAPLGGVTSHAELSNNCSSCHAPFWSPQTMADRCLACHAGIAAQLQDPSTLHAVLYQDDPLLTCRACHPDHRGPDASLTLLKLTDFPHDKLGFPLLGQHAQVACESCHINNVYKGTPTDCYACHASQDIHAGQLGTDCSTCHTPAAWKPSTFDHSLAAFQLDGRHAGVTCNACHINNVYKGTPSDCYSCHAGQDLHDGQLGTDCAACHSTAGWSPSTFDHNLSAFKLTGKHTGVACSSCHVNNVFRGTPTDCYACHASRDIHGGQLGTDCAACHNTAGWSPSTFDHNLSAFKLTGKHAGVACASCHVNNVFKGTPSDCYACHSASDVHNGQFGRACSTCHTTAGWLPATFDHNLSAFKLTGQHAGVACASCHANNVFQGTPSDCYSCHSTSDVHGGQFGRDCSTCHSPSGWLPASFNHSIFPLDGAHAGLPCTQCHTGGVYSGLPSACVSCHAEPSFHAGAFGTNCNACHNTSNWNASYNGSHPGGCDGNCINHEGASCRDCHTVNVSTATCTKCHSSNDPGDDD